MYVILIIMKDYGRLFKVGYNYNFMDNSFFNFWLFG